MKNDVKFICKESGLEVKIFSIVLTECFRRDFNSIGEGTVVEFDREYLNGNVVEICYDTIDGIKHVYHLYNKDIDSDFFKALQNEKRKFDLTSKMIKESEDIGPFKIIGVSRVVELTDE